MNTIIETVKGSIKIVQFNNPKKKNAINREMYIQVTKILSEAAEDSSISVVVLTGSEDYYSSGNDLKQKDTNSPEYMNMFRLFIKAFITFPKLLIAIGVAATSLGLCDYVFASENAFFYTPFTKLGIVAEGCSSVTFPRLMGDRKAAQMLLFGHKMTAKEALDWGFVNDLYKPEELQSKVWNKIQEINEMHLDSLVASKALLRRTFQEELLLANDKEVEELIRLNGSDCRKNALLQFNKNKL